MPKRRLSKAGKKTTQKPIVRRMQSEDTTKGEIEPKSTRIPEEEDTGIPKGTSHAVTNGLEALELIYEPTNPREYNGVIVNEGFRFGALGETGTGKTTLLRAVIAGALQRRICCFALAHDTKGIIPEYPESVQLSCTADFIGRKGFHKGEKPFASFRGNPIQDISCPVEEVAALSLAIARKGRMKNGVWSTYPHLVIIDEIAEAASEGRKSWDSPSTLKLFEQGRKIGVSVVWTTQSPRKTPPDAMGQSSTVALFRLTGTDRNSVRDTLMLEGGIVDTIAELPNYHFVLWEKAKRWNGKVYKLPSSKPPVIKAGEVKGEINVNG